MSLTQDALYVGLVALGWGLRYIPYPRSANERPVHPHSNFPIVSAGQSVSVIFHKDGVEQSHRRVESEDLHPIMVCPKGGPPAEEFIFDSIDGRGRFLYNFTRSIKDN